MSDQQPAHDDPAALAGATDERSLAELRRAAADLGIEGRSSMDRDELAAAVDAAMPASSGPVPTDDPDLTGRPPAVDVAQQLAERYNRHTRVIGAPTED
jgi:hypothetical protein